MMLAVRSHANADLLNCPDANLKYILGGICWYSSDTNQLKKIFEYVKNLFYGSPSRNFSGAAVNFVNSMAQRPSANIALLRGRAKFTKTLSNSRKC